MIINPTNEEFISTVARVKKALGAKSIGSFHIAVIPTVAGFSARMIDCTDENPYRLEIVDSEVQDSIRAAVRILTTRFKTAEDPAILLLVAKEVTFRWEPYDTHGKRILKSLETPEFVRL